LFQFFTISELNPQLIDSSDVKIDKTHHLDRLIGISTGDYFLC
jgi:hypothetical protein